MRHFFIVNPHSGPQDATESIRGVLAGRADCQVYVTSGPMDAARYVREQCQAGNESLRFYACGGDGTLNEVINGAVGCANAAVGCYPCGSGNDFVKYFGGKKHFLDIPTLLSAPEVPIDLIRVNDRYAVNVVNIGFEALAAARMVNFRRFPLFSGPRSYYPAVVSTLIDGMKHTFRVTADGETLADGKILLCTFANGEYVGGSFRCAPRAAVNDGWLELCMVRPLSRLKFAKMIGLYQRGEHLDSPMIQPYITYRRAKKVEIVSPRETMICLDGEIIKGSRFTVENAPGKSTRAPGNFPAARWTRAKPTRPVWPGRSGRSLAWTARWARTCATWSTPTGNWTCASGCVPIFLRRDRWILKPGCTMPSAFSPPMKSPHCPCPPPMCPSRPRRSSCCKQGDFLCAS